MAYIAHSLDNSPTGYIKQCCKVFYLSDEVIQARDTLWAVGDLSVLPQLIRRQNITSKKVIESTFWDIVDGMQLLDTADI